MYHTRTRGAPTLQKLARLYADVNDEPIYDDDIEYVRNGSKELDVCEFVEMVNEEIAYDMAEAEGDREHIRLERMA